MSDIDIVEELRNLGDALRFAAGIVEDHPVLSAEAFRAAAVEQERAAREIEALRARNADLEMMVRATQSYQFAPPLWVTDEPGRGRGWAVYFHEDGYVFIPADKNDMPIIDDAARTALDAGRKEDTARRASTEKR